MAARAPLGLMRRLPRMGKAGILGAAVLGGLWYWQERDYRAQMSWMGPPEAQVWYDWHTLNRTLRNDGYMVGWSDLRRNPLWVTYRLTRVADPEAGPRPSGFREDIRAIWRTTSSDYTGTGYDRGHMAPNYAIAVVNGRAAQQDTFLMTNVAPQRPALNRKLWQRLEEVIIDDFVPHFGTVWVTDGPIFDSSVTRLPSLIEIPDAFYKILVIPGRHPKMLGFIMPQKVSGNEPLDRFVVSVDEIEARTGLDFFSQLPDGVEHQLESRSDPGAWQLKRYARQPSRY
ncbi:DNA/RNA non-specific endonuclease [Kushneria phosphatilytica]|uniref:DNA/RNA non-specific endonuclease n=1 Tax=Kushneria phosphatilytica TaxID=657387 RepID=A0A1S1NZ76_9GAMM|nr:DNA/RNA non-specific endonuclease [Kushneria phosphatilytica]OHV13464.1 endonuclease [Kushneria phosphatilytica]QEL10552.1 DNA/RNA non-specific endonuclease [Kushneria phosphatilytica]